MIDKQNQWQEDDSALYQALAPVAVPDRAEQMATLLMLIPFAPDEAFTAVELGSGEGRLSEAMLRAFPRARTVALDGSEQMREASQKRLVVFGDRFEVRPFDILKTDWLDSLDVQVAVSSLCVHHLDGLGKQGLFAALAEKMEPRGALLIADLVEPQRAEARELFAQTWDARTRDQALEQTGNEELFELFEHAHWNYYRYDYGKPDAYDTPSPLFAQLVWLKEVGFNGVDCFWMRAAHAVYGGYKGKAGKGGLSWTQALAAAQTALDLMPAVEKEAA